MSSYTKPIGDAICTLLAEGMSLRAICREMGYAESTVRSWAIEHAEFAAQSMRARELGCDALAEQALEIADTPLVGEESTTNPDGTMFVKRGDMLGHRRLQIDTRLRLIGKWHQHKYGDKVMAEHTGPNGGPIAITAAAMTDEQLAKIAAGDK